MAIKRSSAKRSGAKTVGKTVGKTGGKTQPDGMAERRKKDFAALVEAVRQVHDACAAAVHRTVNTTLTLRNWLIGQHIVEYELHGADRATYGDGVIDALAGRLIGHGLTRCDRRELYRYRQFRILYPQIGETLSPQFIHEPNASSFLPLPPLQKEEVREVETASPQSSLPGRQLVDRLSFSHFVELIEIDDPLKRAFYEVECIRGNWSVRTLKRQIGSLYYERSGLSTDKEKLARIERAKVVQAEPRLAIRDPYIFEFLGLKPQEAAAESNIEAALIDNLKEFLLELGHGFCFEACQKSIVIGKTRGFVDLVFYHRILKCHVLVELKISAFSHEHIGHLNTYVAWYRKHMMAEGDNPPIGLLLCTEKDHALVEFVTATLESRLFVSKVQMNLPTKEELELFLRDKRRELTDGGGEETP